MNEMRVGIIGFDTSHVPIFTRLLNDPGDPFHVPGARVVAGYPSFSQDLEASYGRVQGFTQEVTAKWDMRLVSSAEELVDQVDAVLLESVDGRRHLREATPVIQARKPLFIDKPVAASYAEAVEIYRLARENNCPLFSSSSLRFDANISAIKQDPALGRVLTCDAFSPAALDPTNPGLYWYGIHGVEILYTFMGTGCEHVRCHKSDPYHLVVGTWPEGRLASIRGIRAGANDYGVTVFGEKQVRQACYSKEIPLYSQLLKQIVPFFQGGPPPVSPEETLELVRFIEAALLSEKENREVLPDDIR